jgi:hypothetical protein
MDMRLFIRNRERNGNGRHNNNGNGNHPRPSFPRANHQQGGATPMDLSAMGQENNDNQSGSDSESNSGSGSHGAYAITKGPTPNLSSEEYARCRKAGICFRCKQSGHISRNCPTKPPKKY